MSLLRIWDSAGLLPTDPMISNDPEKGVYMQLVSQSLPVYGLDGIHGSIASIWLS